MEQQVISRNPFVTKSLHPTGFWRRLLGMRSEENAAIALENMLAEGRGGVADISRFLRPYRLQGDRVRRLLSQTFAKALTHCLADDCLDEEEQDFLGSLRRRLDLSDTEVANLQAATIHPRYEKALSHVLADQHIDEAERHALQTLQENLRLPEDIRKRIHTSVARPVLEQRVSQALSDRRLSPEEEAEVKAMAENLGIALPSSRGSLATMERYRVLWRIENGDLPEIHADIRLLQSERCYFQASAEWHEVRSVSRHLSDAGSPSAENAPVVRGLGFHPGSVAQAVERGAVLAHVDSGTVYLTNRRVLFDGIVTRRTIRLSTIVSYQVFSDAIVLEKEKGKKPYLFIEGDVELAAAILGAVLGRDGKGR